jgi:hypothetical protein
LKAVGPGKLGSEGTSGGDPGGTWSGSSGAGIGSGEGGGTPGCSFGGGVSGGEGGRGGSGLGLSDVGVGLFGLGVRVFIVRSIEFAMPVIQFTCPRCVPKSDCMSAEFGKGRVFGVINGGCGFSYASRRSVTGEALPASSSSTFISIA